MVRKRVKTAGLPPGTVVYDGEARHRDVDISIIDYDKEIFDERTTARLEKTYPFKNTDTITWL